MKRISIFLIMVLFLLAACQATPPSSTSTPTVLPCSQQAADFINSINKLVLEFSDASQLAGNTARISLAPQIANLQSIRRETNTLNPPPCAASVQSLLLAAQQNAIDAYMDFMADQPDSVINRNFSKAADAMSDFTDAFIKLKSE